MKPSKYQQAVFDFITDGTGSAVIQACAGSGKTTTIIKALELIPEGRSVLMLAFNRSIADELQQRAPKHVDVKTFNGLGHSILASRINRPILDSGKLRKLVREQIVDKFDYREFAEPVMALCGYVRRMGLVPQGCKGVPLMEDNAESWQYLIEHFGVPVDKYVRQTVIDYTRVCVQASINLAADKRVIDFDDQIYIPAIREFSNDRYDWVFVNEAQDVSPVRTKLVSLVLKEGGRLIAVGDKSQAVYGFSGSDAEAMNTLRHKFDADELPLSISYRCAKAVVAAAQQVMPSIEASETAPDGEVQQVAAWELTELQGGDMVICRRNAPVISLAWKLISQGIPARILGRDIGGGLVKLIEKLQPKGIKGAHGLLEKLGEWQQTEVKRWAKDERDDMVEAVNDKVNCIHAIVERTTVKTVPDLIRSIEAMFSDDDKNRQAITLCSIHKSKGLESDRVWFLDADLIPLKCAKQAWQLEQETNLRYVGITRAKRELRFIQSDLLIEKKPESKKGKKAA
jgi:DNA helicase-2/ATP-dependent DNA helicase PcrA